MTIDVDTIEKTTETRVVEGVRLPYTTRAYPSHGRESESGVIFIDSETLVELAEQDRWDSQFGKVLLLGSYEGYALEQAGLAEQETKGGYHGTDAIRALCRRLGWA